MDQLETYLNGAPADLKEYIISGFKFGFRIGYEGTPNNQVHKNATSVRDNLTATRLLVQKEVTLGRFAGPFHAPPFPNFQTSPLSIKPKKSPGKFRLVLDLSAPYDSTSINHNIDPEWSSVHYTSIMDAVEILLTLGRGSFMAKTDIEAAFRIVPVHPNDYHLLCFSLDGYFYYDKCLPMGLSSSCRVFESVARALEWIVRNKFGLLNTLHYLDDWIFIQKTEPDCAYDLSVFEIVCKKLGVPLADDKTFNPSQLMSFLGIQLDSNEFWPPFQKTN